MRRWAVHLGVGYREVRGQFDAGTRLGCPVDALGHLLVAEISYNEVAELQLLPSGVAEGRVEHELQLKSLWPLVNLLGGEVCFAVSLRVCRPATSAVEAAASLTACTKQLHALNDTRSKMLPVLLNFGRLGESPRPDTHGKAPAREAIVDALPRLRSAQVQDTPVRTDTGELLGQGMQ